MGPLHLQFRLVVFDESESLRRELIVWSRKTEEGGADDFEDGNDASMTLLIEFVSADATLQSMLGCDLFFSVWWTKDIDLV
jgi:hypothetical protein